MSLTRGESRRGKAFRINQVFRGLDLQKGVGRMRVTITYYKGKLTITITMKKSAGPQF